MPYSVNRKDYSIALIVVFFLLILIILFLFACKKLEFEREVKINTGTISNPTLTSAFITSKILDIGENEITKYGHCWSNSKIYPTIALETKTEWGRRTTRGHYIDTLTNLLPETKYYVRAYASNLQRTCYGDSVSFTTLRYQYGKVTDYDGNTYNTVIIGYQEWMAENLKTTNYNDGTAIPLVTDNTAWGNLSTSGYCWYNNDKATYKNTYGALYNWYTVNAGNVCPTGWHVPTDADWAIMENYLIDNGYNYDGTTTGNKIAKSLASATTWTTSTNAGAVGNTDYPTFRNKTRFTALPSGYRDLYGTYSIIGSIGFWWSATETYATFACYRSLYYEYSNVYRRMDGYKTFGVSVRCLRD